MFTSVNRVRARLSHLWERLSGHPQPVKRSLARSDLAWLDSGGIASLYDDLDRLRSCLCTQEMLESPAFIRWTMRLEPTFLQEDGRVKLHRKLWEYCYIVQALYERGMLRAGARGLGFAVGNEPLPSYFACQGCSILATDFPDTNERDRLGELNARGLCSAKDFRRLVSFTAVDMNAIPSDQRGFDFCWSSCGLEMLGSIRRGQQFMERMLDTLRPGGVGVHTTQFNVLSNDATADNRETVLFRKRDIDLLAGRLRALGHHIDVIYHPGDSPADLIVDVPPYQEDPHLKLSLMNFTTTSIGLIITKAGVNGSSMR